MRIEPKSKGGSARFFVLISLLGLLALCALPSLFAFLQINQEQVTQFYQEHYPEMLYRAPTPDPVTLQSQYRQNAQQYLKLSLESILKRDSIPALNLNIGFEELELIKAERKEALKGGQYQGLQRSYHKASLQFDNERVRAKIRLKGERLDHISHPRKWSFRVKAKKAILGMRQFSLQSPSTRSYQYEPVFLKSARDLGLLAVRYQYVNLSLNGESIGLMVMEEHFSKELLESQARREGVILKLNDNRIAELYFALRNHPTTPELMAGIERGIAAGQLSPFYRNLALHASGPFSGLGLLYFNALSAPAQVFNAQKVKANPALEAQAHAAISLMRGFLQGHLKAEEVFDSQKFGDYFAIQWLWNTLHASSFRNQRLYFNPVTFLFEPIAYDSASFVEDDFSQLADNPNRYDTGLSREILKSKTIREEFYRSAERLAERVNSGYLNELKREEKEQRKILRKEYHQLPGINFISIKQHVAKSLPDIKKRQYFRREELVEVPIRLLADLQLPAIINAYHYEQDVEELLEFENLLPFPVEVQSAHYRDKEGKEQKLEINLTLKGTERNKPPEAQSYTLPESAGGRELRVRSKNMAQDLLYETRVRKHYSAARRHPLTPASIDSLKKKAAWLKLEAQEFSVPAGTWEVKQMMIFPKSYSLKLEAGAELQFAEGAGIILHGALLAEGTKEKPVILSGENWVGLSVLSSKKPSKLYGLKMSGANFASKGKWRLTGALNFYESDVEFKNVTLTNSRAEDALNVIRSRFDFEELHISNTASDAFDGDFSRGTISNSSFVDIGGDAVDVSGSELKLSFSKFVNVKDKAVSLGEASIGTIKNIEVKNSGSAVAAKDRSKGFVSGGVFKNFRFIPFLSYQKKPEYGPAALHLSDFQLEHKGEKFLAAKKNLLTIDKIKIATRKINIDELYETVTMKKNE